MATMRPLGAGVGSLQVLTVSSCRAAGLPPISTVPLPPITVPLLVGGVWNTPPGGAGGMCGTVLVTVLPTVAASRPSISTLGQHPSAITPSKGSDVGVATGPVGDGTMTTWVSWPVTRSPRFAATRPTVAPRQPSSRPAKYAAGVQGRLSGLRQFTARITG